MSIVRGAAVAALFTLVFLLSSLRGERPASSVLRPSSVNDAGRWTWDAGHQSAALLLTAICWYGADHRLTPRPEAAATFLVVVCCWLAMQRPTSGRVVAYIALTIAWINIHPSALLSPMIAACGVFGWRDRDNLLRRGAMIVGATGALLVNPYGVEGILAPLRLMRTIGERRFVNLEWLPSRPADFPLLYVVIAAGVALFVLRSPFSVLRISRGQRTTDNGERRTENGERLSSALLFVLFAYLALKHVRNQGFFFAVTPVLLAPVFPIVERRSLKKIFAAAAAVVWVVALVERVPFRTGADRTLFPIAAVERLRASGARGHIFNADQFGGYLIWTFYPQRRVLTDGRNELFDAYLREYERARSDSREWAGLIRKYNVALAVEEHGAQIDMVDAMTGKRRRVPAWRAFFPTSQWALIAADDVGMVFARRDSHPRALLERLELHEFPEKKFPD